MGRVIYRQKFSNNQRQQTISLMKQAPDVYIIEVFDGYTLNSKKLSIKR